MRRARRYWLMKSEPGEFSIDDLARVQREAWEGVRNYQARNFLRDEMAEGDEVLFYHSNASPTGVVGVARVVGASYPDPSQFDSQSPYFDAKSRPEEPRWYLVDVEFVDKLARVVTLAEIKEDPSLEAMLVARRGMRLSVQPVEREHFRRVLRLGGAKARPR